jgi:hypothetical protein
MDDGVTCMAFTVSFIPHTGNKYFIGACDASLRLYDFENAQVPKEPKDRGGGRRMTLTILGWIALTNL